MNWITNSVLPKIKALVQPKEVPENFWVKCKGCDECFSTANLRKIFKSARDVTITCHLPVKTG